jgi:hypothetical protein
MASLGLALALSPAALAQQGNMPGMNMQGQGGGGMNMPGHNSGDMDMQTMMNKCAQMRRQMKPGARMTADMQRMMTQCDEMDRQMGASPSDAAPPATRNR